MPSARQIAANRKNAKKSTGPRSEAGREASRGNARRHGLAVSIRADSAFHDEIECLAKTLALSCGRENVDERAREAAAAEIDLLRIRKARAWLLDTVSLEEDHAGPNHRAEVNDKLAKLERYERRAFSRRSRALRDM
jgi:hypothetical protein